MYYSEIKTRTSTGKLSHVCKLIRRSFRDKDGKPQSEVVANVTHWPEADIEAIKFILKNKKQLKNMVGANPVSPLVNIPKVTLTQGKSFGSAYVIYEIADRLGIVEALGKDTKLGKLALWLVLSRVLDQGSRLSAVRLHNTFALADIIGIDFNFTEDNLYASLQYIGENQYEIESNLFSSDYKGQPPQETFLFDLTSSYFEGVQNIFAAFGYSRDGKRGKVQIELGLVSDRYGNPISIEPFLGNVSDMTAMAAQMESAKQRLNIQNITYVGDRGSVKGENFNQIIEDKNFYITCLTKAQIEKLMADDILQIGLFDNTLVEITQGDRRLIFRRNPMRADEVRLTRESKLESISAKVEKSNKHLKDHPKALIITQEKEITELVARLKCKAWVGVKVNGRSLELGIDQVALQIDEELDGCYVMVTNCAHSVKKEEVHTKYKDLIELENTFSDFKTTIEIQPWYVRTEKSTRGHALSTMLAYKILRELQILWREIDMRPMEALNNLQNLCVTGIEINGKQLAEQIPTPDKFQAELLKAAGIKLPSIFTHSNANVRSRKKLIR